MLYNYPLSMRFKIIALAPQIYITDANNEPVLYVRQKILNLREDVRIFRDDSKTEEVFRIHADRIIDIGARYQFYDSQTDEPIGSIKQRGLKTFWRAHYDLEDAEGNGTHILTEDDPWVKVIDGIFESIPFVGMLSGYVLHPSYTIVDQAETPILRLTKEPAFFESMYTIENMVETLPEDEEKRLLLGLLMMIQLTRARG